MNNKSTNGHLQSQNHQPQRQPESRPVRATRYRASRACRRCNEKRVKCDASERGTPCTRCESRNETDCTLIQSRRGIYPRKPRRQQVTSEVVEPATPSTASGYNETSNNVESINVAGVTDQPVPLSPAPTSRSSQQQSHPHEALPQHLSDRPAEGGSLNSSPAAQRPRAQSNLVGHRYEQDGRQYPGTEQAHTFPGSDGAVLEHETPSGNTDTSNASSYREISWATMFDHLLERQQKGEEVVDKCSITYLGESFPLAIVLKDLVGGGQRPQLHHPGPPYPANEENSEPSSLHHPLYMRPEEIAYLEAKKTFELPDKETLNTLVNVFLDRVFPLYPIVARQEFLEQYQAKRIPWILLHAVCFISATFCPSHVLYRSGFQSRREERWLFYSKAKALFDIGYEGNKIVILQVTILMSFWGGGPNNYWNFYSWISTGVTVAETLGCHRSMDGANIRPADRSLLKRLWWVLMIRDTACAALVGRPFRVNLDHCDTDSLTSEDFQHDMASPGLAAGAYVPSFALYQIEATRLSLILRRIIITRYYPKKDESTSSACLTQNLADWRSELPPRLAWSDENTEYSNIFASTLSVMYNHCLILAYLNCPPEPSHMRAGQPYLGQPLTKETLINAAQRIAATACAVVTKSDILLVPHELLHGIFIAAVVFYMQKKTGSPLAAQLGMSGLTNCQMVLHESRESWDPSSWITQLFDKVLFSPQKSRGSAAEDESNEQNTGDYLNSPMVPQDSEILDQGFDIWHGHPVLGTLFDFTQNTSVMTPSFPDWSGLQPPFSQ